MHPKKNSKSVNKNRNNTEDKNTKPSIEGVRLNKFLANAGLCNRRQADAYIKSGLVRVNGKVVTEMGTKVLWKDKVFFEDRRIYPGEKVYVLLNKPKGFVGTNKPLEGKKTLYDIVRNASTSNLYVADYLGTNDMGLVLLTNDGYFAQNLGQGERPIQQLYKVQLNKALSQNDLEVLSKGVIINGKKVFINDIAYADDTKKTIGIELRSPIKDVVSKIFDIKGYKVTSIDRVIFAGLTKKNLARGQWRFLKDKEVLQLKKFI